MDVLYVCMQLGILLAFLILGFLLVKLFRLLLGRLQLWRKGRRTKPFRVDEVLGFKDRHIKRRLHEAADKVSYTVMPVIHFSSTGNVFLIPSYTSDSSIKYTADKSFTKQRNEEYKITVHYADGHYEEGWACSEKEPGNFVVNPVIDDNAVIPLGRFVNSFMRLERDFVRRSILNMSKEQLRVIILFFMAGIGIGSVIWVSFIGLFMVM